MFNNKVVLSLLNLQLRKPKLLTCCNIKLRAVLRWCWLIVIREFGLQWDAALRREKASVRHFIRARLECQRLFDIERKWKKQHRFAMLHLVEQGGVFKCSPNIGGQ